MKRIISFLLQNIPRHYLHRISHFLLILISPIYRGNNFEDPIDGRTYRKLLPYGRVNVRKNAFSPHSMALERHRLIWLYLKEKTDFFMAPHKFLHIAPEYCFLKPFKNLDNIEYVTGDLISPWASVKMDITDMPFADNSFDVIMANHILEHIEDEKKALSELYRVMKPGGWGIFQVPLDYSLEKTYEDPTITDPLERQKHFLQKDHVRLYGRDYPQRLEAGGFKVTCDDFARSLDPELAKRYAIANSIIYYCQKE